MQNYLSYRACLSSCLLYSARTISICPLNRLQGHCTYRHLRIQPSVPPLTIPSEMAVPLPVVGFYVFAELITELIQSSPVSVFRPGSQLQGAPVLSAVFLTHP